MKAFLLLFISTLLSPAIFCNTRIQENDSINAVRITLMISQQDSTGAEAGTETFVSRIYYNSAIIAIREPLFRRRNGQIIKIHNTVFIAHRDSIYGYVYEDVHPDSLTKRRESRANFMSKSTWISKIYCFKNLTDGDTTFRSSYTDNVADCKEVIFDSVNDDDTSVKHTYYMDFTNAMQDVPFSLSPELDSIYGMKLCKFWMVHYPFFYKPAGMHIPLTSSGYFMEKFSVPEDDMMRNIFRQYKKDAF